MEPHAEPIKADVARQNGCSGQLRLWNHFNCFVIMIMVDSLSFRHAEMICIELKIPPQSLGCNCVFRFSSYRSRLLSFSFLCALFCALCRCLLCSKFFTFSPSFCVAIFSFFRWHFSLFCRLSIVPEERLACISLAAPD